MGCSTTDTASSPGKAKKVLVNLTMQGLVTQLEFASDKKVKTLKEISKSKRGQACQVKQVELEDVARCLRLAVEAGAEKASNEYYIATQLFRSGYNRYIFNNFDSNEERLGWLKRAI